MTIPALSQTYYSDANYALDTTSAANFAKSVLFAYKAALKKEILTRNAGSITGWTCYGSSDSVTAALDGVDRWGSTYDATKIITASGATPHSWMVLYHSGFGLYIIIDYNQGIASQVVFTVAKSAPTGGSITARPTATGESTFPTMQFCDTGIVSGANFAHRTATAAGHFMVLVGPSGAHNIRSVFTVWPLADTKAGDSDAWVVICDYAGTGALRVGNSGGGQWRSATPPARARNAAGSAWLSVTPAFWVGSGTTQWFTSTQAGLDVDGKIDHAPIFMTSTTSPTIKGRLLDCHQTVTLSDGYMYPVTSAPTHMSVGNLFIPFGGIIPRM